MTFEEKRSKYCVKDEYVNDFYGSADQDVIEDCQTNGIPVSDIIALEREWGDIGYLLEEI